MVLLARFQATGSFAGSWRTPYYALSSCSSSSSRSARAPTTAYALIFIGGGFLGEKTLAFLNSTKILLALLVRSP